MGVLIVVLGAVCLTVVARVVVVDVGLRVGSAATAREAFEEDHCSIERCGRLDAREVVRILELAEAYSNMKREVGTARTAL